MELVLKPSTIEPLPQDLAFLLHDGSQHLRRREVVRVSRTVGRTRAGLPLIFVEGALNPLHAVSARLADYALNFDETVAGLIQDLDIRLQFRPTNFLHFGVGKKAGRRRGMKVDTLDLDGYVGFAFRALPEARRQCCERGL